MTIRTAVEWLANSGWSIALHESQYAYAVIESIHVWTLCLFVGFAVLLDLRLIGVVFRDVPVSQMTGRLLPWMKAGFAIMVVTGILLFFAIPLRSYLNIFFRIKVVLLILAGLNAFVFHNGVYRRLSEWDRKASPPRSAWFAGICSMVLWAAIVFSGRLIAYNWLECGKPQSALTSALAGCTAEDIDPYR